MSLRVEFAKLLDGDLLDVAAPADRTMVVGMGDVGGLEYFLDQRLER